MFPRETSRALDGFEVLERLGAGGAGEVYLARSPGGRLVAIKVLGDFVGNEPEVREGLAREAKLCSRLVHPAIVQLRAFVDRGGISALVFEYVEGVALARVLRFVAGRQERLPDAAAWHVLERVLDALAFAHANVDDFGHSRPIVHRDVSPSNVLLDWNGGAKLTDFGMGKILGASSTTRVGIVKGTPGCMSPEQARGERVTERADVYAAALLGLWLATGRAPFRKYEHDDVEMARAMRNPRVTPLAAMRPDLPARVHDAFAAALEPNPDLRTITARELQRTVRESCDIDGGQADLARLLGAWRAALEQTVARPDRAAGAGPERGTLRYEEVALALAADDVPHARALADEPDLDDTSTEAYARPSNVNPSVSAFPAARVDGAPAPTRPAAPRSAAPGPAPDRSQAPVRHVAGISGANILVFAVAFAATALLALALALALR